VAVAAVIQIWWAFILSSTCLWGGRGGRRIQIWWAFILATVLLTLWFEPYCLAFAEYPGL
jgi:hypothetical protein